MSGGRRRRALRLTVAVVVAVAMTAVMITTRGYPWHLASIVGVAAAFLAFYVFRAADNLRGSYRE